MSNVLKKDVILFLVALMFFCVSCEDQPTIDDIKNIEKLSLKVEQSYLNYKANFKLPIKELITDLLSGINIDVVDLNESSDAILSISLEGKPYIISFKEHGKFCESADIKGSALLEIEGFATKKVKFKGVKYEGASYYPFSNRDPQKPLEYAGKRAILNLLTKIWGSSLLLQAWNEQDPRIGSYTQDVYIKSITSVVEDIPSIFDVSLQACGNNSLKVRLSAVEVLYNLTHAFTNSDSWIMEKNINPDVFNSFKNNYEPLFRLIVEAGKIDNDELQKLSGESRAQSDGIIRLGIKSAKVLGMFAKEDKRLIQELVRILESDKSDFILKLKIVDVLGGFGNNAKIAIPGLKKLLELPLLKSKAGSMWKVSVLGALNNIEQN